MLLHFSQLLRHCGIAKPTSFVKREPRSGSRILVVIIVDHCACPEYSSSDETWYCVLFSLRWSFWRAPLARSGAAVPPIAGAQNWRGLGCHVSVKIHGSL